MSRFPFILLALVCVSAEPEEAALRALEAEAKTTNDPGFVAFQRGVRLANLGRYREAEIQFERCLDDSEIPADRKAKAIYNRGVCLAQRGEADAMRLAIDCFIVARDNPGLRADAMHNLEVAKLKWAKLKAQSNKPQAPDEGGYEQPGKTAASSGGNEKSAGPGAPTKSKTGAAADGNMAKAPGAGQLPVIRDDGVLTPMTPEDTRAHLDEIAARLQRQRQAVERLRAGPERPNVRNW